MPRLRFASLFGRAARAVTSCAIAGGLLLGVACAHSGETAAPDFTATAYARMDPATPRDQARRDALAKAEKDARDQLRDQVYQMRLSDGRTIGDLAAVDPFVRAVVMDALRAAPLDDRTFGDDGTVSASIQLDLAPLYTMIADYPKHALR